MKEEILFEGSGYVASKDDKVIQSFSLKRNSLPKVIASILGKVTRIMLVSKVGRISIYIKRVNK